MIATATSPRIDTNTPAISIVIPMYNVEKYVETCIDSILVQTFQDFEIIIVDDCSTDRSLEIVQKKYSNDPRIKIYKQLKNSGDCASRNLGLINSRGKYVYFMDSDDAILSNCLETFYNAIEKSGADVVHLNSYFNTTDDFVMNSRVKIERKFDNNPKPRFLADDLTTRMNREFMPICLCVVPWNKISRREFLTDSGLYFPLTLQNGDFLQCWAELCFARKIQVIDACCYVYRQRQKSKIHQSAEVHFRRALKSIPTTLEFIHEVFSSPKIISKISQREKDLIEAGIIRWFFDIFFLRSYRGELSDEKINEILHEVLYQPSMMNPEIIRAFTNTIAFFAFR